MLLVVTQELGVKVEDTLEIERLDVEKLLGANLRMEAAQDGGSRIELADLGFNLGELRFVSEVDFVQEDLVSEAHLRDDAC